MLREGPLHVQHSTPADRARRSDNRVSKGVGRCCDTPAADVEVDLGVWGIGINAG